MTIRSRERANPHSLKNVLCWRITAAQQQGQLSFCPWPFGLPIAPAPWFSDDKYRKSRLGKVGYFLDLHLHCWRMVSKSCLSPGCISEQNLTKRQHHTANADCLWTDTAFGFLGQWQQLYHPHPSLQGPAWLEMLQWNVSPRVMTFIHTVSTLVNKAAAFQCPKQQHSPRWLAGLLCFAVCLLPRFLFFSENKSFFNWLGINEVLILFILLCQYFTQ